MRTFLSLQTLLVLLLFSINTSAQKDTISLNQHLINQTYLDQYIKNVDFAYIAPGGEIGAPDNYVLSANFKNTFMVLASRKWPFALSITPEVLARVRKEQSAGVRTPSFRVAGNLHYRIGRHADRYKYVEAGFTHHSNGQDGAALNADGSLNTVTGNFTTNFLTAAYRFGHYRESKQDGNRNYGLNHKIGVELHRLFKFEKAIQSDYGFTRLVYQFSMRAYDKSEFPSSERWRLNADFSYATNAIKNYKVFDYERRLNGEISYHYSFPFMGNVFLMGALGYYGEDPYNIYYRNHYGYIRVGISANISKYLAQRNPN